MIIQLASLAGAAGGITTYVILSRGLARSDGEERQCRQNSLRSGSRMTYAMGPQWPRAAPPRRRPTRPRDVIAYLPRGWLGPCDPRGDERTAMVAERM